MKSYLEMAMAAARMAGEILVRQNNQIWTHYKDSEKHHIVSNLDLAAEKVITDFLKEHFPSHQILAEESGLNKKESPFKWIIDPLDGTVNYIHGLPLFCVSIGLEFEGSMVTGVVYDPVKNDLFYAEKGKGSFLNGEPIHVSEEDQISHSLLVTGFSYDFRESPDDNFTHFLNFSRAAQGVRRTGSAALDLCYVATGYFDGYWELNLSPWDVAAGSLIVEEAGGKVTGFKKEPYSIYSKNILATNGNLHLQMIEILQKENSSLP